MDAQVHTDSTGTFNLTPTGTGLKLRDGGIALDNSTPVAGALTGVSAITGTINLTGVPSFVGATGGAATAALLFGGGTTATKCSTSVAGKNFIGFWTESTATSGDSRGCYLRHYLGAAGSGEALRAWCTATAANVATGGTANGAHISFSYSGAAATVSGQAHAARLTLGADAQTRTLNGNVAVLNLDSDIAAGNTVPASVAFVKVTDTSAVRIGTLLRMPDVSNGTIFAAHTTQTMSHSIKIISDDGTAYYIMCTNAATNRS